MAVFYNQATLRYNGGSINSNITTGEIAEAVTVSLTAVSASFTPGGTVTYVVSVANAGAAPVTDVTVTDDLGGYRLHSHEHDRERETQHGQDRGRGNDHGRDRGVVYPLEYVEDSLLYYVDGIRQPTPTVNAGPPLVISGLEVPAGDSIMLIYEARVTGYAPLGEYASIDSTVSVTGSCITAPLTATASVPMEMGPVLSISKSVSPQVVTGCSELTYTFVIQNSGSEAGACVDPVVTDTFDPVLRELVVTLDGETLPCSAYTYDPVTGEFATASGTLTVPGAAFERNRRGCWTVTPGVTVLTVTGVI